MSADNSSKDCFDLVGIGFGPANIALAIAAEENQSPLRIKFLEKNKDSGWQDEMLLPGSDIQNHPLRDLVTPRNPRSRYTFVNFLFENDRLFPHLNLPLQHPLRLEYRQYVKWVARHFSKSVEYGAEVKSIQPIMRDGAINFYEIHYNDNQRIIARSVVLAPGRTPNIPPSFEGIQDSRIVHLSKYLSGLKLAAEKTANPRIAVVGGSQTAVEILLHLAHELPAAHVTGISRNFGFRLKDTSPFSDEVYFPEFVETFFHADQADKNHLRNELIFSNYSSADRDVIDSLYVHMYSNKIQGKTNLILKNMTAVTEVGLDEYGVHLGLKNTIKKEYEEENFDLVVLATGFKDLGNEPHNEPYPKLMESLSHCLKMDQQAMTVDLNYRVQFINRIHEKSAPFFLNGLCESSHGMGDAGSFSLLSLRPLRIFKSLEDHWMMQSSASDYAQSM